MRGRTFGRLLKSNLIRTIAIGSLLVVATLFATRPQVKIQYCGDGEREADAVACHQVYNDNVLGVGPDGWTAIFTGVLAFFTAVLTSVSFIQIRFLIKADGTAKLAADAAVENAKATEKAIIASNRAWLRIDFTIHDQPLTIEKNKIYTAISIKIHNTGNAIAMRVAFDGWIFFHRSGSAFDWEFEEKCEISRIINYGAIGSIFPGERYPADSSHTHGYVVQSIDGHMETIIASTGQYVGATAFIGGCVSYSFPSDTNRRHQTRILYQLGLGDPRLPIPIPLPIPIASAQRIPVTQLKLAPVWGHGAYAD